MKQKIKWLFGLILIVSLLFSVIPIHAEPIINGAGNDGELANKCQVGMNVCWSRVTMNGGVGNDYGIRVTVIKMDENNNMVSIKSIQDYSNEERNGYFYLSNANGLSSKFYYDSASTVSIKSGYENKVKTISPSLPWLINTSTGANNFGMLKEYFQSGSGVDVIASNIGMTLTEMISTFENGQSKYKLLIEPVAYVIAKLGDGNTNIMLAMTPTEMALFNKNVRSNYFYYAGPNIFYSVFAKAMYLQEDDLGFTAKAPTAATYQNDGYIIDYLGMSIISFGQAIEEEETPDGGPMGGDESATYRYNTEVYVSYTITNTGEDRHKGNKMPYSMVGSSSGTICSDTVEIPEGESQRVWCKWTTPSSVAGNRETISVKADGSVIGSIDVTYQKITGKEPPDTNADDKKPNGWSVPNAGISSLNSEVKTSTTWTKWYSENNHYDGKVTLQGYTFTGLGDTAAMNIYREATRTKTRKYTYSCAGATGSSKSACETNGGTWTQTGSYWDYSAWSWTGYKYDLTSTSASEYFFYKYGNYECESTPISVSQDLYKKEGNSYSCKAKPDTSKPYKDTFTVSLNTSSASADITPDPDGDPTGTDSTMKSGYGINSEVKASFTTSKSTPSYAHGNSGKQAEHTNIQSVVATFPEFKYQTYQRVLEVMSGNCSSTATSGNYKYEFTKNKYDIDEARTHFTPIWFPNNKDYEVKFRIMDFWTPGGHMQYYVSDDIEINGNIFDDWHMGKN